MRNVQTTLEAVSVGNGYQNTLTSVQRFRQDGQEMKDMPMVVLLEGGDDVESDGPIGGGSSLTSRSLTLSVVLVQQQNTDEDGRSASEVMNSLLADVQKAMQVDHTRGGVALDTEEIGVGDLDAEEGQPELVQTVSYRIRYRHRRTDPTIAG